MHRDSTTCLKAICCALIIPFQILNPSNQFLPLRCLLLHMSVYAGHRMYEASTEQTIGVTKRYPHFLLFFKFLNK